MSKITTNLWFDNQAEEAANFYTSIFKDSSITDITRYGKAGYEFHGRPEGSVMTVAFELDGDSFVALNGGPMFQFNEAISLIINCDDQNEVDYFWQKLTADGGEPSQCGWLKDKYGVSWQVVPKGLQTLLANSDPERQERVMSVLMTMIKLDLNRLEQA
ncbi:VOC family protein [Kangiella sp. M94]